MTIRFWLRRLRCLFRGHDEKIVMERNRIFLACCSCPWQSEGVGVAPARRWLKLQRFRRRLREMAS